MNLGEVAINSKLAASYSTVEEGGEIYFQDNDDKNGIAYQIMNRNGQKPSSGNIGQ